MLERRKHHRGRDFACGTIVDGRRNATYDCVLRNLSDGGALLLVDEPSRAPVELELAVRGGMRAARIVWRSGTEVGIAFAAAGGAAATGPARVPDPRGELVAELSRVGVAQVDLVAHAVETEGHRLGGRPSVEVVLEDDLDPLCHGLVSFRYISRG